MYLTYKSMDFTISEAVMKKENLYQWEKTASLVIFFPQQHLEKIL